MGDFVLSHPISNSPPPQPSDHYFIIIVFRKYVFSSIHFTLEMVCISKLIITFYIELFIITVPREKKIQFFTFIFVVKIKISI